jgi:hypothetical protein
MLGPCNTNMQMKDDSNVATGVNVARFRVGWHMTICINLVTFDCGVLMLSAVLLELSLYVHEESMHYALPRLTCRFFT